jgi:hypothetical protein
MFLCEISIKEYLLIIYRVVLRQVEFMKIMKTFFLAFIISLITVPAFSAKTPPSPPKASTQRSASTSSTDGTNTTFVDEDGDGIDDGGGIIPVDLPINQDLIYLMIGGLVLATTVLYKNRKKASI